jgi:hypothetical protein
MALINCFCPPLVQNTPRHQQIALDALERSILPNEMQQRVRREHLDATTENWVVASSEVLQDFPLLTIPDLEKLTLGIYQLSLAKLYTRKHLDEESKFNILLNTDIPDVVRAKLSSRFISAKSHELWIQYDHQAITGYFCKCWQGARTVGMCSHVTCVQYYH